MSFNPELFSEGCNDRSCFGVFCDNLSVSCAVLTSGAMHELIRLCEEIEEEIHQKKYRWQDALKAKLIILLVTIARYINPTIKVQICQLLFGVKPCSVYERIQIVPIIPNTSVLDNLEKLLDWL